MAVKLRNLFVVPRAKVASPAVSEGEGQTVRLQVDGMVCGI